MTLVGLWNIPLWGGLGLVGWVLGEGGGMVVNCSLLLQIRHNTGHHPPYPANHPPGGGLAQAPLTLTKISTRQNPARLAYPAKLPAGRLSVSHICRVDAYVNHPPPALGPSPGPLGSVRPRGSPQYTLSRSPPPAYPAKPPEPFHKLWGGGWHDPPLHTHRVLFARTHAEGSSRVF